MSTTSPPWHALLAPLSDGAMPTRGPVVPEALAATQEESPVAGWQQLSLFLSAGEAGLRNLLVVLDESGRPIAASDHVLHRQEERHDDQAVVSYRHESLGGRLEADGTFKGTHWEGTVTEEGDGESVNSLALPDAPSYEQILALKELVAELCRRAPASG